MKFLDLFAGIGGFRRGMELAGHECIGFCEFDKFATASYTSMHLITDEQREYLATLTKKQRQKEILKEEYRNGEWYCADIRDVTGENIPKADCWCFGSPCVDFSVAGHRAGLEGDRSSLVREVFRILGEIPEEDRPEWLIYENVKGMLSSNRGFDFLAILLEMDELGFDIEWQLFNSKDYVPQNRERVYTIGHLRSRGPAKVFPIEGADGEDSLHRVDILGHRSNYRRNQQVYSPDGITEILSTCQGGGREHHTIEVIGKYGNRSFIDKNRVFSDKGISPAVTVSHVKDPIKTSIDVENNGAIEVIGKAYERDNYGDNRNRILGEGGGSSGSNSNSVQRTVSSGVTVVGNTNPSGKGMNGNCYFSEGINPAVTCNKNEGNRIAIPIDVDNNKRRAIGIDDTYRGRDPYIYEQYAPTLRSERFGFKVGFEVKPVEMSGNKLSESEDQSHTLNANDQRKIFGANQKRTMVGNMFVVDKGIKSKERDIVNCIESREDRGLSARQQEGTLVCHQITNKSI